MAREKFAEKNNTILGSTRFGDASVQLMSNTTGIEFEDRCVLQTFLAPWAFSDDKSLSQTPAFTVNMKFLPSAGDEKMNHRTKNPYIARLC